MKSAIIGFWILCALASAATAARLYYWTDDQGIKHVSDRPPTENVDAKAEEIKEPKRDSSNSAGSDSSGALDRMYRRQKAEEAERDSTIQYNQQRHELQVQAKKEAREREINQLRKQVDRYRAKEDLIKRRENNAYTEEGRLGWKSEREEGEAAERRLRELESQ